MTTLVVLVLLAPVLLLSVVCLVLWSSLRSGEKRRRLRKHRKGDTHVCSSDSLGAKLQAETAGTLDTVATSKSRTFRPTGDRALQGTIGAIPQLVLDGVYRLTTEVPLLMVNQLDHQLFCMTRVGARNTRLRADEKNAELLSSHQGDFPGLSTWSDDEAPEEEMSDSSWDEDDSEEGDKKLTEEVVPATTTAPSHLFFDGLEFYLAVSQVRERTVRTIVTLGMAKTLTTLREQQLNESIAIIEQQYPDFTCLSTSEESPSLQQLVEAGHPPMDLLTALQLPWHKVNSL
uniref:RxLR effector candidate protein n=1 Tax=Hyaloperonospora arabidopsidis (strain Emoy2) TaxID=559515 RepID=M4B689_HYAAE|nr:RxLR effector candidate protein [Hyaloperonospora arabidopsidis Emoy2]